MAKHKTCFMCGKVIENEEGVPYKGRFTHSECFNIAMKAINQNKKENIQATAEKKKAKKSKPLAELKNALSEQEYEEKQQFFKYLREIIQGKELNAKVYVLTEDYIKKYNFTYQSMHQTLVYLNEIIEKELTGDVIGIIPYYHDEAIHYFQSIQKVEDANKDIDISKMYQKKVIKIHPKKRIIKQIDIESVGKGAD